jgi:hypothetical protein
MKENPYRSPAPSEPSRLSQAERTGVKRPYRIIMLIGYSTTIGASAALWLLSHFDESVIQNSALLLFGVMLLWIEFIGVLCSLTAIPLFLVRALYLLALRRFTDTVLDTGLAGGGFFTACCALILNPITD